jgi:hypothetical protein
MGSLFIPATTPQVFTPSTPQVISPSTTVADGSCGGSRGF